MMSSSNNIYIPMSQKTLVSYYKLFNSGEERDREPVVVPGEKKEDRGDDDFWIEDEWTEEDRSRAEALLLQQENEQNLNAVQRKIDKFEKEAGENWERFYTRNENRFFKDRHYLEKEFPELFLSGNKTILELGCGVGNAVLPLLTRNPHLTVHGYDVSSVAIDIMTKDERFVKAQKEGRAKAGVWDITQHPLDKSNCIVSDGVILLFCLSAVSPEKQSMAVKHVVDTLKSGGLLFFRDYGRYDEAQLKLGQTRGRKLSENFYLKQDGTRVYYFDLDDMKRLFVQQNGLEILELKYLQRTYSNRGDETKRRRVWVQAKFRKQ